MEAVRSLVGRVPERLRRWAMGRTFRCPVCHLELSLHDVGPDGLVVCPLCGVVLEVTIAAGHVLPVVLDIELERPVPWGRWHPLLVHLPLGALPLAVAALAAAWLVPWPVLGRAAGALLPVAAAGAALAALAGWLDWRRRYRGRPYRIVTVKLWLSGFVVALAAAAAALHGAPGAAAAVQLAAALGALGAAAVAGHLGGWLVYGR